MFIDVQAFRRYVYWEAAKVILTLGAMIGGTIALSMWL